MRPTAIRRLLLGSVGIGFAILLAIAVRVAAGQWALFAVMPGAELTANGQPTAGYVHSQRLHQGYGILVTLTNGARRQSYFVAYREEKRQHVSTCPEGSPGSPIFLVWHETQLCNGAAVQEPRIETGQNFVEFSADNRSRFRVRWRE